MLGLIDNMLVLYRIDLGWEAMSIFIRQADPWSLGYV